jgi:hypothetical protein
LQILGVFGKFGLRPRVLSKEALDSGKRHREKGKAGGEGFFGGEKGF